MVVEASPLKALNGLVVVTGFLPFVVFNYVSWQVFKLSKY